MNQRMKGLFLLLLFMPTRAFASGQNILPTLYLISGSLVLFFVVLLRLRLTIAEKAVLAVVYLLTLCAVVYGTNGLAFTPNKVAINFLLGLAPVSTTVAAWLLLWRRKRSIKE